MWVCLGLFLGLLAANFRSRVKNIEATICGDRFICKNHAAPINYDQNNDHCYCPGYFGLFWVIFEVTVYTYNEQCAVIPTLHNIQIDATNSDDRFICKNHDVRSIMIHLVYAM